VSTVNHRLAQLEQHVSRLEAKIGNLDIRLSDIARDLLTEIDQLRADVRPRTFLQRLKALFSGAE
jgi:hypothetical protein